MTKKIYVPKRAAQKPQEKIGDVFVARVKGVTSDGQAVVSHPSGRTFFVSGLWLDEEAELKITGLKSRVGFAECITLLQESEFRRQPPCPHHGNRPGLCGGCPWQFIDYNEQLEEKQRRVEAAFSRLDFNHVLPIWPSPETLGYRNRAQFKTDGKHLGYVSPNTNTLAPIDDCIILTDQNRQTLKALKGCLPQDHWRPLRRQQWTTLDIDESISIDNIAVNRRLLFQQANGPQNIRMKQWLDDKLGSIETHNVALELFCGSGNFTEVIVAKGFNKIYAVEGVEASIDVINGKNWSQVEGICADLFKPKDVERVVQRAKDAEVLILDPPRDGLKTVKNLLGKKTPLRNVFYISCDVATLVRDIAQFQDIGFKVCEVQALDQFPHTPHIECLVHLKR